MIKLNLADVVAIFEEQQDEQGCTCDGDYMEVSDVGCALLDEWDTGLAGVLLYSPFQAVASLAVLEAARLQ